MSLEADIQALTAAVLELSAKMSSGGAAPAAGAAGAASSGSTGSTRGRKPAADKPAVSQEQMVAALTKLKDDHGAEHAKKVIADVGKVAKMGEIPTDKYEAVYKAACEKHDELSAGGDGGEDDGI